MDNYSTQQIYKQSKVYNMAKPDVSHFLYESSFMPEILTEEHRTKFACHPHGACFNACCKQADDMLKVEAECNKK